MSRQHHFAAEVKAHPGLLGSELISRTARIGVVSRAFVGIALITERLEATPMPLA